MATPVRVTMTVNGEQKTAEVEPRLLLVHYLRDHLGLTGTHVGCDTSNCGACTVHLDGDAVKSCTVLAVQAEGAEVTTIEGIGSEGDLHPVQEGFWEHHGLQCGYCTPGMIMAGADLLAKNAGPDRGGGPRGARGQPLPLHGLPQHRQGRDERGEGRGVRMTAIEQPPGQKWVGQALRRKEDPRMITGQGPLRRRHGRPGHALHGRRALARGARQDRLDRRLGRRWRCPASTASSPARTSTSAPACRWRGCRRASRSSSPEHWPLAKGAVKYVGQGVVAIVGEDKYAVVDAAEQVLVEYDPLPVVVDPEKALEDGSPLVHEEFGTNTTHEWSIGGGDMDAAWAEADVVVERRIVNHRTAGTPIEPRVCIADYRGGALTLHLTSQNPHLIRLFMAGPAGHDRGRHPGHRPGRRRRLRREDHRVPGGDPRLVDLAQGRPRRQVDRDPLGAHELLDPRARPDRLREGRRQARRHDHRARVHRDRRLRRVLHDAHAVHLGVHGLRDQRLLQDPEPEVHRQGRLHQQDGHRRDPRRRAGPRRRT